MPLQPQDQSRRLNTKWAFRLLALAFVAVGMTTLLVRLRETRPPVESAAVKPVAIARTNLVLTAGRLCMLGQTNVFTGLMIEHSADGSLRSRSAVTNGLLHGVSEGWHTNGQLQVTEHFHVGASQGVRTKWYADGARLSEAMVVEGQLHGAFRRWHANGALAEQMEMKNGQPDGIAKAWFPNGSLKSETTLQSGKVVAQKFWKDGESKATTPAAAALTKS